MAATGAAVGALPTRAEVAVFDESGDRWIVRAGDPASKYINTLRAKGFGLVVLPRRVLTSGSISGILDEDLHTDSDEEFVRRVRLNACLSALEGGAVASSAD